MRPHPQFCTYNESLCTVRANMTMMTDATKQMQIAVFWRTCTPNLVCRNSPQTGLQRLVTFLSKKKPLEQCLSTSWSRLWLLLVLFSVWEGTEIPGIIMHQWWIGLYKWEMCIFIGKIEPLSTTKNISKTLMWQPWSMSVHNLHVSRKLVSHNCYVLHHGESSFQLRGTL